MLDAVETWNTRASFEGVIPLNFFQQGLDQVAGTISQLTSMLGSLTLSSQVSASSESRVLETALTLREMRLKRRAAFPTLCFADPEWSMLLDLFIEQARGRPVSVSSLCIASEVPPSTAMRFIATMVAEGLLEKTRDASDARRVFVTLSSAVCLSMQNLLENMAVSRSS